MRSRCGTGVLTFHRCINYGSYWQARCLMEGLRRRAASDALRWARTELTVYHALACSRGRPGGLLERAGLP